MQLFESKNLSGFFSYGPENFPGLSRNEPLVRVERARSRVMSLLMEARRYTTNPKLANVLRS